MERLDGVPAHGQRLPAREVARHPARAPPADPPHRLHDHAPHAAGRQLRKRGRGLVPVSAAIAALAADTALLHVVTRIAAPCC